MRVLTLRTAWSGFNSVEKVAVVLALIALTMAAWVLNSRLPKRTDYILLTAL